MSECIYCGENAGFLKKLHAECEEKHLAGSRQMLSLATIVACTGEGLQELRDRLTDIAKTSYIAASGVEQALIEGWERALNQCLEDSVLSTQEEALLMDFARHFSLSQEQLDKNGAYSRAAMSGCLRDILDGKTPSRFTTKGAIPFNLQKGEDLIWIFGNVPYHEEKIRRQYEGASQGVSIRIMKGVYYRAGAFKGRPVETSQVEKVDVGLLGVTSKHLYFCGGAKSFRISYGKILSFVPYGDGIGVYRDVDNAKQQVFKTGEGWFIYNLLVNLSQRDKS
jgi:hypothetical protein